MKQEECNKGFVKISETILELLKEKGEKYDNCFLSYRMEHFFTLLSHKLMRLEAIYKKDKKVDIDTLQDLIGYAYLLLTRSFTGEE